MNRVMQVVIATYGAALIKKATNEIPAALPMIILGTEEMRVSRPPILVSKPSINKKLSNLSILLSFFKDTPVSEPTMIIAVTLFNTAENTTVITP
jgi:hypothetical protein